MPCLRARGVGRPWPCCCVVRDCLLMSVRSGDVGVGLAQTQTQPEPRATKQHATRSQAGQMPGEGRTVFGTPQPAAL